MRVLFIYMGCDCVCEVDFVLKTYGMNIDFVDMQVEYVFIFASMIVSVDETVCNLL